MWDKVAIAYILEMILKAIVWKEVSDGVSFTIYLWLFWPGSVKSEVNWMVIYEVPSCKMCQTKGIS